jgi:hypothetical protein
MADTKLTKSAGEYFVCYQLARHKWAASLTRDALERTDVLASHTPSGALVAIQVKAANADAAATLPWPVGTKAIQPPRGDNEWYAFVALAGDGGPTTWIVPRAHVAAVAWAGWHAWRYDPAHEGKRHSGLESTRLGPGNFSGYAERWDLLELPTSRVPVLLAERDLAKIEKEGLPDGHPGLAPER